MLCCINRHRATKEVLPGGVLSLLECAGAKAGERFYDLGSGTGKVTAGPLVSCHLSYV